MEGSSKGKPFCIKLLIDLFSKCYRQDDIWLKDYCDAYSEVSKLLSYFGKLFYFVNHDVEQKLEILYKCHASNPTDYKTVKTMTDYEFSLGVTGTAKNKAAIGCRTLLRLHRALLFVIELMTSVCSAPEDTSLRALTKDSYHKYLAEYHPWAVRKAVDVAVYSLPSREDLVNHIVDGQPDGSPFKQRETCKDAMLNQALPVMRKVYDRIQNYFVQHNMLHLP